MRDWQDGPIKRRSESPKADRAAKAEALKYVIHFIGDMHQPLHDEDDADKGGNDRRVIFDGHPDNLHWVWDTGLLNHIRRNADALAAELESRISPQDREEWAEGSIEDWVLEGHRLAQRVAYGDLGNGNPGIIKRRPRPPWSECLIVTLHLVEGVAGSSRYAFNRTKAPEWICETRDSSTCISWAICFIVNP